MELPELPHFGAIATLLVEDNARLRALMTSSLEALGCAVRAAASAGEALELLDAGPAPALLISDVRMPGAMDGMALAQLASARDPALRVLLLTGYSAAPAGGFELLNKPFTLEELAAAIERVLAARRGA